MNLSMSQSLSFRLEVSLACSFGETIGDIPLYSLHRIRNFLRRDPPALSAELRTSLERAIIRGNLKYQEESGNTRWACLTSNNLVDALEAFDKEIGGVIAQVEALPHEAPAVKRAVLKSLQAKRATTVEAVKRWFDERSEHLVYDLSGNVPWSVVCRLRKDLSRWIAGVANPFKADICDTILEIAKENGIAADTAEDAWERMGGKIFKAKSDD